MRYPIRRLARVLTEVVQPPVVFSVLLVFSDVRSPSWPDQIWAGVVGAIFTCLIPWAVTGLQVLRGSVTDRHVSDHKQRAPILLVALGSTIVGVVILLVFRAPSSVFVMLGSFIAGIIFMIALSPFWKVSGHATAVAGTATITTLMFGWPGAIALLLIPAVGWSRLLLKDHSLNQVVAGTVSGVVIVGGTFAALSAAFG